MSPACTCCRYFGSCLRTALLSSLRFAHFSPYFGGPDAARLSRIVIGFAHSTPPKRPLEFFYIFVLLVLVSPLLRILSIDRELAYRPQRISRAAICVAPTGSSPRAFRVFSLPQSSGSRQRQRPFAQKPALPPAIAPSAHLAHREPGCPGCRSAKLLDYFFYRDLLAGLLPVFLAQHNFQAA
jgi:hypothetical protein